MDPCSGTRQVADRYMVGSLKMNTALEYSTRVVQEGDRRCKKSTLNDLAYLTPLRIPLMNPVILYAWMRKEQIKCVGSQWTKKWLKEQSGN